MSAIARFKEYFGMSPVAAYEDEYLDDYDRPIHHDIRGSRALHEADDLGGVARDRRADYGYAADRYGDEATPRPRLGDLDPVDEPTPDRRHRGLDDPAPRPRRYHAAEAGARASLRGVPVTRGAVALAPEEDFVEDGLVTLPETVVERPRGFGDGKSLGEHFRAGRAVVLDLSTMASGDARRMVDFAAGLVFGLDGRMEKVTDRERTFLLQPAGMDLTEAEVRDAVNGAFRR
ncbi:cell division protein SepF [Dietzia natronolimnaea]|uniref:Cell division protein SepF n=1 Tax=Dietzia natronolimnaea TaxID=161920 RepID=A0A2A2WTM5_9ACTN|nr:cell division protein SepF [Dietzia natronolimnaea]PAY24334.1 cell division protein SepF [Dietzia natronolimnaea]